MTCFIKFSFPLIGDDNYIEDPEMQEFEEQEQEI